MSLSSIRSRQQVFMVYWGWVALREDFRTYRFNAEIQELLHQGSRENESCSEDEERPE